MKKQNTPNKKRVAKIVLRITHGQKKKKSIAPSVLCGASER